MAYSLGWSDLRETPSLAQWFSGAQRPVKMCLEVPGGQQRCFSESESQIAINNACERTLFSCDGGNAWCCPAGSPDSAGTANPGYVSSSTPIPWGFIILGLTVVSTVTVVALARMKRRSLRPALAGRPVRRIEEYI